MSLRHWSRKQIDQTGKGPRLSVDTKLGFMLPLTWDLIMAVPSLGEPKMYMGLMTAF
jgi:hypothetical protein